MHLENSLKQGQLVEVYVQRSQGGDLRHTSSGTVASISEDSVVVTDNYPDLLGARRIFYHDGDGRWIVSILGQQPPVYFYLVPL